jgi:hypothetical protein
MQCTHLSQALPPQLSQRRQCHHYYRILQHYCQLLIKKRLRSQPRLPRPPQPKPHRRRQRHSHLGVCARQPPPPGCSSHPSLEVQSKQHHVPILTDGDPSATSVPSATKKSTALTTPSGAGRSADKTCTGAVLRLGGESAWTERPPLPAFTAGRRGSMSGRSERRKKCRKIFFFFVDVLVANKDDSFGVRRMVSLGTAHRTSCISKRETPFACIFMNCTFKNSLHHHSTYPHLLQTLQTSKFPC